jgi:DNA-binding HxlR family transcriptional regulator
MPTEENESHDRETLTQINVSEMLESVIGCKWSLQVLACIRSGTCRPTAIEKSVAGLSAKVLNERLTKLQRFGIIDRTVFAESPPRVEYRLTPFGSKFVGLVDAVETLQREVTQAGKVSSEAST